MDDATKAVTPKTPAPRSRGANNRPVADVRAALPLDLSLRIRAFEVEYGDVVALDVNHVIDLERSIEDIKVDVLAAGEQIATGRFVSVNGSLAVQIEAMSFAPPERAR